MHSVIQICKWRRERPQHMLGDPNIQRICNFDQPVRPMHTGFIEAGHRSQKVRNIENASHMKITGAANQASSKRVTAFGKNAFSYEHHRCGH